MLRSLLQPILVAVFALLLVPAAHADPASDFTLRDVDGKAFTLSDHKGEVIVLSFWATWCGPCKEEMPHLQRMYNERKDEGFLVLSISTDDARGASKVKPFIRSKGFTFPVVLDRESTVSAVYNPSKTLPWTVVIDRNFEIVDKHAGYDPGDEVKLAAKVDELLAAPTK